MTNRDRIEELLGVLRSLDDPHVATSEEGENATSVETTDLTIERPEGTSPKSPTGRLTPSNAFRRRDTHPFILFTLLTDKYGILWLDWDPEVIWKEVQDDFSTSISAHSKNKINAVKTMLLVDSPWTEWEVFNLVIFSLTDNIPDFRVLQRPSPDKIITGITIMGGVSSKHEFSEEVCRFIAACFMDAGVFYLPPPADFAQKYVTDTRYHCRKCDRVDVDDDNEKCDFCGAPQAMLVKARTRDPDPVQKRYDEAVSAGDGRDWILEENVVDVQVAKLLRANQTSKEFQDKLLQQLQELENA